MGTITQGGAAIDFVDLHSALGYHIVPLRGVFVGETYIFSTATTPIVVKAKSAS